MIGHLVELVVAYAIVFWVIAALYLSYHMARAAIDEHRHRRAERRARREEGARKDRGVAE